VLVTCCTLLVTRGVLKLKKAQHVTSIICFPMLWAACLKLLVFFSAFSAFFSASVNVLDVVGLLIFTFNVTHSCCRCCSCCSLSRCL
jgi:hypothetical protein